MNGCSLHIMIGREKFKVVNKRIVYSGDGDTFVDKALKDIPFELVLDSRESLANIPEPRQNIGPGIVGLRKPPNHGIRDYHSSPAEPQYTSKNFISKQRTVHNSKGSKAATRQRNCERLEKYHDNYQEWSTSDYDWQVGTELWWSSGWDYIDWWSSDDDYQWDWSW